jgi:hypothetical protein
MLKGSHAFFFCPEFLEELGERKAFLVLDPVLGHGSDS